MSFPPEYADQDKKLILEKIVSNPPKKFCRRPNVIPFHIPHKKLLERIEYKKARPEPLSGFQEEQNKLIAEKKTKRQDEQTSIITAKPSQHKKHVTKGPVYGRGRQKREIVDQNALINMVRNEKEGKFYYMVYAEPRTSEYFKPYGLVLVPYNKIDKCDHITISKSGLVQTYGTEVIFTSLEQWEYEYIMYCKLTKYKTFSHFRVWKAFYIWKKKICWEKIAYAKKNLEKNLFILHPVLRETLLLIQEMCFVISPTSFVNTAQKQDYQFFYFIEDQMELLEIIVEKLKEFRSVARDLISSACHRALLDQGFTTDDSSFYAQFIGVRRRKIEGEPRMSYMEQAKKKRYCVRLSCFITLVDYMVINTLHKLVTNSIRSLLTLFTRHSQFLPRVDLLNSKEIDTILLKTPRQSHMAKDPFFFVDLTVDTHGLHLDPSKGVFKRILEQLLDLWTQSVYDIPLFLSDNYFNDFLQPILNCKVEDRICGQGPRLQFYLQNDHKLATHRNIIMKLVNINYKAAELYIKRFQYIQEFYTDDIFKQESEFENETALEKWRAMCERYFYEVDEINKVVHNQPLGLLAINIYTFKEIVLPEPLRLLNIINHVMPELGKNKVNTLTKEAEEMQTYLNTEPLTTLEYVKFIEYLDKAQAKVDEMESELDYLKELYDIMEEYHIAVSPDEMTEYLGVSVTLGTLRSIVDKKVEERAKAVTKFSEECNREISLLINSIGDIREECMASWLIDIDTNLEDARNALGTLFDKIVECQKKASEFKSYQKQFRTEVSRFEFLDEVVNDIKLRKLLWDTMESWYKTVAEWFEADYLTLDVEDMNTFTAKCVKNVTQLEKGLPRNLIVPKLKEDIATVKDKLPVVGYLRNSSLRQRHWLKIESLLNHKFKPDEVITLNFLEELHAFTYPNELMELSAQASSEASLEIMLKKVEEVWKTLEFIVFPHKETKDVYIMGTLEEVQQVYDDSNITINTIVNSRHVGPIKSRVEDWVKKLDHFNKTLEQWQTCQQNWIYLEVIFGASDIQRQLPQESRMFNIVDKSYKEIMKRTLQMPLAMEACSYPGLLETLTRNNALLDQIMKCLEEYLETKRVQFPRFYFLSNDELLEILAQTRNPLAVQPHLRKCFDAIAKLDFVIGETAKKDDDDDEEAETAIKVVAMLSPEGEKVPLFEFVDARGNVEVWLKRVEEVMFGSLKLAMQDAIADYKVKKRQDWVKRHANQIVLTVSQIMWAADVHSILDGNKNKDEEMLKFEKTCNADLNMLAGLTRTNISAIFRKILVALITISVHARDTIENMVTKRVHNSSDFEWLKMLRYYWLDDIENCVARMSSAEYIYGYEYLGAGGCLVITPLTDKCYLCLMGALQLDLGGAPAGPAGTGKTETTKDLAKALAIQCVVFNCSEGLDYKMMGRFFSGLAQSGAWCCFDEFNRIDIEVLSVIAQQLITIRNAKAAKAQMFMFEGREIKLVQTCAAFITMNPGYAGRTELPDNLKALFRPVSMMVPDYALIAEVTLYSEGFESSKNLAQKMVQMYKLCSEQLSQQDHYDFGMRAVKSVLVMAGALKRANPDKNEDVVLIRALRDSNLPKFLADDAVLFQGILSDLFPGVELPEEDYGVLQTAMETVITDTGLQIVDKQIVKVIQLYETMIVRWGVMLVGPTGGGKTSVLNILKDTLTKLYNDNVTGQYYRPVRTYVLNPKSVTLGELYGEVNPYTMEWKDGLLGIMVRTSVQCTTDDHQWVICDGPVDAVWIENMNTVLDDNKMLCLANSERIKLTPYVHMVFEVQDLAQASPATVSRCGMVYIDAEELKWLPYVKSWAAKLPEKFPYIYPDILEFIISLFENYVESAFVHIKKNSEYAIHQVDIAKVNMMCNLFESIIGQPGGVDRPMEKSVLRGFLTQSFVFSYLWSTGGNLLDASREKLELHIRDQFDEFPDARLPNEDLWGVYMNIQTKRLEPWARIVPQFQYNNTLPFFEMIVPTVDTIRFGYVMEKLIAVNKPVLYTGGTGVGKSVIAKVVLNNMFESGKYVPVTLNFSAQTSSARTQEMIEIKLEKKKKNMLGAPVGKKIIVFVDDVNMPKLDTYGSQPPIELLRQYLDFGGLYDRDKMFWKTINDVIITAACAPPGGGRNPLTPRFVRHFAMLLIPPPNDYALKAIFRSIMRGFLDEFSNSVRELSDSMVSAAVDIYERIAEDLLPTPAKSHYVFNLRDLSKCIQGVLQADAGTMRESMEMQRLFYHECLRVFHDRLINIEDKSYFYYLMRDVCNRNFGTPVLLLPDESVIQNPPVLLFGDFMVFGAAKEDKIYEEIKNIDKMKLVLQDYLEDFNLGTSKEMKLIFFMDALEHLTRIARILRAERGNALLVGVGGMGKQSLTKLASHVNSYKCGQIELTRNYDHASFFEDVRKFYFNAGAENENTVFLFTDTQIVEEEFLEDINNILNSGDVPNLFEADEYEKVINAVRPVVKQFGIAEGNRDGIYEFFINRVRKNLHLSLCMSPVGDAFRRRCRMFPSLVNCCTIDWFMKWPEEALLSVAVDSLQNLGTAEFVNDLATICVTMHKSVEDMSIRFYNEMRRHFYTTPSSYLDLLKLYDSMLSIKKEQTVTKKLRIANGLKKLYETNELIDEMKETLTELKPQLAQKSIIVEDLMKYLAKEQTQADVVRNVVKEDEKAAMEKADEAQALADDAQRDLSLALPAMEAAAKALEALNKNDINELRVFQKPPQLVRYVMEAVCLLLGSKIDWQSAKITLGDTNFLRKLQEYDKDNIPDAMLKKLKPYIENPDFKPEIVVTQSKVCKSMCMWVRAIDTYSKVYRIVEPKRKKQQNAERELNQVMTILKEKQRQLAEVEAQIAGLQAKFDAAVKEKKDLEDGIELTGLRLVRAGQLTLALGDEQIRWELGVKSFDKELENMVGDVLLAAACVAYLGAFTSNYREELTTMWLKKCHEFSVPCSDVFSLIAILADPYAIRVWNTCGLPRDNVSTENAILVTQAGRWPLMIDPQEQANRWIRQMEVKNQLQLIKLTDANFMRSLENAILMGLPVLLEEIEEQLDPTLEPILLKQTFVQAGRLMIRLGDTDMEYDKNFRFYMTTKLANPHYLPEICIKVTLVNFTVTPTGLEDQLLADVVRLERPDLESLRNELIVRINEDKSQLNNIEEKILRLLFFSEGNILDDEELIETLNESKETSAIIASRLLESETTEENISVAREKYRSVATRGSVLFFVVARLADIDPMYQYSLKYFKQIFNMVIETSEKNSDLNIRLDILYKEITLAIYVNVSRGLFEKHKLIFSFMLCVDILKQAGEITDAQWNFLLRGPIGPKGDYPKKPDVTTLSEYMWIAANYVSQSFNSFKNLVQDVLSEITVTVGDLTQVIKITQTAKKQSQTKWNEHLNDFEKLMLIKCLKEEKLVFFITEFVKTKLGKAFCESPQVSLHLLYQDTSNDTPLVFVLSTGSDPFGAFQRFAAEMGNTEKIQSISLGQGQGPVAEKLIETGKVRGDWVFLQNCHLATSWMLAMERIIRNISEDVSNIHTDFRLFLSSMPSKSFPVSVLQNSVKVTNEPPKGLRANIKRAFTDIAEEFFEEHVLEQQWRSMIFGISMFHAVIQERKKFGPLGWNIMYEFNDSDRECALDTMKMFCSEGVIPWDALEYITGEITYGGRVTDYWDLRCLKTILTGFFAPPTLEPDYKYSESGIYYCPTYSTLQEYREFIDNLPIIEEPEIFGMHENANIAYQIKETQTIILTILESQPRTASSDTGKSSDEIVYELSEVILETVQSKINSDEPYPALFKQDSKGRLPSLTTVLMQEIDRFNKLLKLVHSSLDNLQKAIKGFVVMSDSLEEVFTSFLNNQVPKMWAAKAYPSLKSLGSWVHDLKIRIDFISFWLNHGLPNSFWISGFFFPQGFLTGTLQTHARKYDLPIDQLKFDFTVTSVVLNQEMIKLYHDENNSEDAELYGNLQVPEDGVNVHGIFLDAARWNMKQMILEDQLPGEMNPPLPALVLTPVQYMNPNDERYVSPLYKTSVRAGVLSTTGHSTNFVVTVLLPSKKKQSYWILKGTALLTQTND